MSLHRQQLNDLLAALRINANYRYSWFGRRSPGLPKHLRETVGADTLRSFLVSSVQHRLYSDFYIRGHAAPTSTRHGGSLDVGLTEFVKSLSQANQGIGCWRGGWQTERQTDDLSLVRRNGLSIWAPASSCRSNGDSEETRVLFPKEYFGISPGFYLASGDLEPREGTKLLRCYWNVAQSGAAALMAGVTGILNDAGIAFQLKVANNAEGYDRCDSAVLYLESATAADAIDRLTSVYLDLMPHLYGPVPAMTLAIGRGVSLAEDPGGGESFGLHRCKLIAEALVTAHEAGITSKSGRLDKIVLRFDDAGLRLSNPYLGADSPGVPNPGWLVESSPLTRSRTNGARSPGCADWMLLAERVSAMLTATKHCHGERCTWTGYEAANSSMHGSDGKGRVLRTLGPNLYSGTSGIAWFLSEFAALSGDKLAAETARAASHQTLARINSIEGTDRLGLYSGFAGIILACLRIGTLLEEQHLRKHAVQLAEELAHIPVEGGEADVMSGVAGTIIGLLSVAALGSRPTLLAGATNFGRHLISQAQAGRDGLFWTSKADPEELPLTGLSHGSSGIALALLRVFAATGIDEFRKAGIDALRFEQAHFDRAKLNWPDYRGISRRRSPTGVPHAFSCFWCHGAPGIALARVEAQEITGNAIYGKHAAAAFETIRVSVLEMLARGMQADTSLCHGICGNVDILMSLSARLGIVLPESDDILRRIHLVLSKHLDAAEKGKPTNGITSMGPGLMLGLTGIGVFALRRMTHTVPDILGLGRFNTKHPIFVVGPELPLAE